MTGKYARAISLTEQPMCSDTKSGFSIRSLTKRVLGLCPIVRIDSSITELGQSAEESIIEVANAIAFKPYRNAKHPEFEGHSMDSQSRAVNAFAKALRQVSPDELHRFMSAADMFTKYDSQNHLFELLRECSTLAAMVARNIALGDGSVSADRAFLSGVLSEIGALACLKVDTDDFQTLWMESGGLPVQRAEMEITRYGGTTHELGRALLTVRGFPAEVSDAVGTAVDEKTKTRDRLARIAAFSRMVATELVRCSKREHQSNLIRTIPKFGAYFNLKVDSELFANPSITPLLNRDIS